MFDSHLYQVSQEARLVLDDPSPPVNKRVESGTQSGPVYIYSSQMVWK